MSIEATPLVKWVGGKRRLVPELSRRLPPGYTNYYEPFIGGGAFFFNRVQRESAKSFFISDINEELINVYQVVRDSPHELLELLRVHKKKHNNEYYYQIRAQHNLEEKIEMAARMLYLNKTCFNGLYRVNKKGEFNVPIGKYTNPDIVQEQNILQASKVLQNTSIKVQSFETITPNKGDFVYFDPPYYPLNKTANFTSYTEFGFDEQMQVNLLNFAKQLDKKGVYFIISNSDTPFTRELYKDLHIDTVQMKRAINSDATKRGAVNELLVSNYEVEKDKNLEDFF